MIEYAGQRRSGSKPGIWYRISNISREAYIFVTPNNERCYIHVAPIGKLTFNREGSISNNAANRRMVIGFISAQIKACELLGILPE